MIVSAIRKQCEYSPTVLAMFDEFAEPLTDLEIMRSFKVGFENPDIGIGVIDTLTINNAAMVILGCHFAAFENKNGPVEEPS